jgi:hypothetical protein
MLKELLRITDRVVGGVKAALGLTERIELGGHFEYCLYDEKGNLVEKGRCHNQMTTVGRTQILQNLSSSSTITSWYVGLIDNASFSALSGSDTLASHSGWSESSAYSGNRPAWTLGTAASQSISNSASVASFSMNATKTINGAFICSASSGTSGTLLCEGSFSSTLAVQNGYTLTVTYTLSN